MTSCCRSQSCSVVSSSGLEMRQAGVVDDQVDPAEGEHGRAERRGHRVLVGHVGGDRRRHVGAADLGGGGLRLLQVEVGDDDAGALGGEPVGDRLADARGRRR